jgi:hypothetical protein
VTPLSPRLAALTAGALCALSLVAASTASATTPVLRVTQNKTYYHLDDSTDYTVVLPAGGFNSGGLILDGGRNVTVDGGHISVPANAPVTASIGPRRGLMLSNQTGRVVVQNLRIDGAGLSEGIQMDQEKGARVWLTNIAMGAIHAQDEVGFTDNHPDLVQTWAGPKRLVINGLTGTTDFQGVTLMPTAKCATALCQPSTAAGDRWELHNIQVKGTPTARVLFWREPQWPMVMSNVWALPASGRPLSWSVYPTLSAWAGVNLGVSPAAMTTS